VATCGADARPIPLVGYIHNQRVELNRLSSKMIQLGEEWDRWLSPGGFSKESAVTLLLSHHLTQ
jgi:hypothetical protein